MDLAYTHNYAMAPDAGEDKREERLIDFEGPQIEPSCGVYVEKFERNVV